MISTQYIGMDVHKESISIAVRNAARQEPTRGQDPCQGGLRTLAP